MTNDLNFDDLCNLIANNVSGGSPKMAEKYLKGIYMTILRQLELNQRIYFKDFGYFEIKPRKSGERLINDPKTGEKRLVYVEPKFSIFFKESENFDYAVNGNGFKMVTTKTERQKKRNKRKANCGNIADLLNKANKRKE